MSTVIEGGFLEETEDCASDPLPFKFKYFFTKDPCKKCLVRPACTVICEPRYALRDQRESIRWWKDKIKRRISKVYFRSLDISCLALFIAAAILVIMLWNGCRQVNHERAEQYYDQHVKHFPEEEKP